MPRLPRRRCCCCCCHSGGLLESLRLVFRGGVGAGVRGEPAAVAPGERSAGDDDRRRERGRCCCCCRRSGGHPAAASRGDGPESAQPAARAAETTNDERRRRCRSRNRCGGGGGGSSDSSSSRTTGRARRSPSSAPSGNQVVLVALPRQVRGIQHHAHGPVDIDITRVDPLLRPARRGADVAEQVGVDDVARRERDAAAVDRAADDAGSLKVLDVAQATEVAALVVAEAVEAVDGVAVLEDRDPAAVELLGVFV